MHITRSVENRWHRAAAAGPDGGHPTPESLAPGPRPEPSGPEPSGPGRPAGGWVLPLAVLIVGGFMATLDTSIVNVALPTIRCDLDASPHGVEWVVTGYTLTLGVAVPLAGWLGDRLGRSRLYLLSLLAFVAASALCGVAWDLGSMIVFRILQAVPGGLLPVVVLTLLHQTVPKQRIGAAMGIYGLGVIVAPAVGPVLGGWLVQDANWRLIFCINVPIGLLGAAGAWAVFPRAEATKAARFDHWGFVAIAYGLFALLLAFSEGQDWGWDGYRVRGLIVSGVLSLALFAVLELESDAPLVDLRVFRFPMYTTSLVLLGIGFAGLFTTLYLIPQYLQNVREMQAFDAGLVMVPSAAVMVVLMPLSGRFYDWLGPRWPVVVGLAVTAYGSYLLAAVTPWTPRSDIELWTTIRSVGTGLAMMPTMTAGVAALPAPLTSSGSGMNNVMQRVASSVAVAVLGAMGASATAQLMTDRGALMVSVGRTPPRTVAALAPAAEGYHGPNGQLAIYRAVAHQVAAQVYGNDFYLMALISGFGAVLALLLRPPAAVGATSATGE